MNEPIVLESNQIHATITENGICPTLSASMGLGGGYVPMIIETTCIEYTRSLYVESDVSGTLRVKEPYGGVKH